MKVIARTSCKFLTFVPFLLYFPEQCKQQLEGHLRTFNSFWRIICAEERVCQGLQFNLGATFPEIFQIEL